MIQPFDDTYFMKKALQEAQDAFDKDEIPVGAVIVIKDRIIARAHNLTERLIEVEDNGVGMDQRQQERLFTNRREVSLGTNKEKGVGLGLLLCADYSAGMGGRIEVRSQKDKGTCFSVTLPKKEGLMA